MRKLRRMPGGVLFIGALWQVASAVGAVASNLAEHLELLPVLGKNAYFKSKKAASSGIPEQLRSLFTGVFDINEDQFPDLFFLNWLDKAPHIKAFINQGKMKFREVPVVHPEFPAFTGFKIVRGLLGGEGPVAVVRMAKPIAGELGVRLFRVVYRANASSIEFIEVDSTAWTKRPILESTTDFQVLDSDRDGILDLIFSRFYRDEKIYRKYEAYPPLFLQGKKQGDGKWLWEEQSQKMGFGFESADVTKRVLPKMRQAPVPSYAVSVCDLNGDGRPEILLPSYGRRWNHLFQWDSGRYAETGEEWGFAGDANGSDYYRGNGNSFASVCADIDNDQHIDLFQGEITHRWAGDESDLSALLWNEGDEELYRDNHSLVRPTSFDDRGDISASWGDVDLDGFQDLAISDSDYPPETQLLFFKQESKRRFANRTIGAGLSGIVNPKGAVWVDLDRDGDLDLVMSSSPMRGHRQAFVRLFENTLREGGALASSDLPNFIGIRLRSASPAVPAVPYGSKVQIYLPDSVPSDRRILTREFVLGYGPDYQMDEWMHFGLGVLPASVRTVKVKVTWSDGWISTLDLPVGTYRTIKRFPAK